MFGCLKKLFKKKKGQYLPKYKNEYKVETAQITSLINKLRKNRLKECTLPIVFDVAYEHSKWMEETGSFSHKDFGKRSAAITEGTDFKWIGENLARGYQSPEKLVNAWNNSQGHREIMLNETYKEVSIAKYGLYTTAIFLK